MNKRLLKEISFKMTITVGGGVNVNLHILDNLFKSSLFLFGQITPPPPYKDRQMQIDCGGPESLRTICMHDAPIFNYSNDSAIHK